MLAEETTGIPGWFTWAAGYGYDANGSLASQTYPKGLVVTYAPNALGQATQAGSFASGVQYHPNGAIKQFTYGNGLVHTMVQNARQLPGRSTDTGGALDQQYHYDANGNVGRIEDHLDVNRQKWLTYDGLDRLTEAAAHVFGGDSVHRFTYDPLDNLRSWKLGGVKDFGQYQYDTSNRLSAIQTTGGTALHALTYDVQGNLASKDGSSYSFDYGNRLRLATVPGNVENFVYDGHGRRVLSSRSVGGYTSSMYTQSGQVVHQWSGPQQKRLDHVYLGGSLVAVREEAFADGALSVKYQHTDALGSPVAMTNAAGAVVERTNYDPYGGAIGKVVDGVGYTGHVMDGSTGLTYMQQRYYDQGIGRFLSVDPISSIGEPVTGFNRYWYASNNPYRFTDPDGRKIQLVADATAADIKAYADARKYLDAAGAGGTLTKLDEHAETVFLQAKPGSGQMQYDPKSNVITWDPTSGLETTEGEVQSPALQLVHEGDHALGDVTGTMASGQQNDNFYDNDEERRVIDGAERDAARKLGEPIRTNHRGTPVKVESSTSREKVE